MTKPLSGGWLEPFVYGALQKALFLLDPERAHHMVTRMLRRAQTPGVTRRLIQSKDADPRLATRVAGISFTNPIGMAAGFDKEADVYNALLALGFGHVEIGTVTPKPQAGNPKPRIRRFKEHQALVNRMGFPGPGMEAVVRRMRRWPPIGPVGINIGPNKETASDKVADSVARLAERLASEADYLAVNVSSPNTPGLRELQTPVGVSKLIQRAVAGADGAGHEVPVWLKLHPDSDVKDLLHVARAAVDAGATGIIAVNTTRDRKRDMTDAMDGGMSGAPLHGRALDVVRHLHHGLGRDTPIIGVGGVMNGDQAFAMMQAGASLVQTYTGFIYGGPRMPVRMQDRLLELLDANGMDCIEEAIGSS